MIDFIYEKRCLVFTILGIIIGITIDKLPIEITMLLGLVIGILGGKIDES